jgi:hypothetical protein
VGEHVFLVKGGELLNYGEGAPKLSEQIKIPERFLCWIFSYPTKKAAPPTTGGRTVGCYRSYNEGHPQQIELNPHGSGISEERFCWCFSILAH